MALSNEDKVTALNELKDAISADSSFSEDQKKEYISKLQNIGSTINPPDEKGLLGTVGDLALRGLDYTAGLTRTAMAKTAAELSGVPEEKMPKEAWKKAFKGEAPSLRDWAKDTGATEGVQNALSSVGQAAMEHGLTGIGATLKNPSLGEGIVNTAATVGDIALDPTLYTGVGPAYAALKALSEAKKVKEIAGPVATGAGLLAKYATPTGVTKELGQAIYKIPFNKADVVSEAGGKARGAARGVETPSDILFNRGFSGTAEGAKDALANVVEEEGKAIKAAMKPFENVPVAYKQDLFNEISGEAIANAKNSGSKNTLRKTKLELDKFMQDLGVSDANISGGAPIKGKEIDGMRKSFATQAKNAGAYNMTKAAPNNPAKADIYNIAATKLRNIQKDIGGKAVETSLARQQTSILAQPILYAEAQKAINPGSIGAAMTAYGPGVGGVLSAKNLFATPVATAAGLALANKGNWGTLADVLAKSGTRFGQSQAEKGRLRSEQKLAPWAKLYSEEKK